MVVFVVRCSWSLLQQNPEDLNYFPNAESLTVTMLCLGTNSQNNMELPHILRIFFAIGCIGDAWSKRNSHSCILFSHHKIHGTMSGECFQKGFDDFQCNGDN